MSTAVTRAEVPVAADSRMAAFLAPGCPEVFHSVATPTAIWQADPYDVETIHAEARATFEHVLNRAGRIPPPPSGAVLVLLGEAGSGKTHLMRAFRTRAHGQGLGYCAYLQMTTEASNYSRYMLTNLIDGLEQPYDPTGPSRTGLARLSAALLESVPGLSGIEMDQFREGDSYCDCDATRLTDDYADRLQEATRFRSCDLELLQVMLHMERTEPQVHSRALMWLRCQAMRPQDCAWIGNAIPRTDDADPMRMLQQLAKLTDAVHGVPLVILIDQLEDMANQSAPVERFLKVIDAITAFTDTIPNTVVVLACLEDYFKANVKKLTKSKQDRLVLDPEPIRLLGNRTVDEIREMTARRLAHLYDMAEVDVDPANELYPFRDVHFAKLNNLRARDALDFLRRHHQRCITEGQWEEPEGSIASSQSTEENDLDALWNDFHSAFQATVPDNEEDLAAVLADAIGAATAEMPNGFQFDSRRTRDTWKSRPTGRTAASTSCSSACVMPTRAASRSASKSRSWRNALAKSPSRSCARPTSRSRVRLQRKSPGCYDGMGERSSSPTLTGGVCLLSRPSANSTQPDWTSPPGKRLPDRSANWTPSRRSSG